MAVHRYRSPDGEIAVALHDPDRQVMAVDRVMDIPPGNSCLYPYRPARGIEGHYLIETAHVEMEGSRGRDLAAHAETPSSNRYRARPFPKRGLHIFGRARPPLVGDGYRVEL